MKSLCCNDEAAYELLMPSGQSFPVRLLACEFGAQGYAGPKRRFDSSPGEQHASQPDAVGHGRRAAALRAGVGG